MMRTNVVMNFVAFQVLWLLSVFAAADGYPWFGPLAVIAWVPLHLKLHSAKAKQELLLIVFAGALGYILDSMLVTLGIIHFPEQTQLGMPTSLWMVALWINLAMTIRHSLDWLNNHYIWISLFGGIGGALAYWAGERLGAVIMPDLSLAIIVIFSVWFFALPVIYLVSNRLRLRERAAGKGTELHTPMKESQNNA